MKIDVEIGGVDLDVENEKDEVFDRILDKALPIARQLAPYDTGRLRASIQRTDNSLAATADYAYFVHEGSSDQLGVPFLADAIKIAEQQL